MVVRWSWSVRMGSSGRPSTSPLVDTSWPSFPVLKQAFYHEVSWSRPSGLRKARCVTNFIEWKHYHSKIRKKGIKPSQLAKVHLSLHICLCIFNLHFFARCRCMHNCETAVKLCCAQLPHIQIQSWNVFFLPPRHVTVSHDYIRFSWSSQPKEFMMPILLWYL